MKGREFVRFIDLMIRCEIAAQIRDAKKECTMSVDGVVNMVDCIQAREYHGTRVIGEIDKKERDVFETFHIDTPKEVMTGRPPCWVVGHHGMYC